MPNEVSLERLENLISDDRYLLLGHGTGRSSNSQEIVNSILENGLRTKDNSLYYTTIGLDTSDTSKLKQKLDHWEHLDSKYIILVRLPIEYINMQGESADLDNEKYGAFTIDKQDENGKITKYLNPKFIIGCYDVKKQQVLLSKKFETELIGDSLADTRQRYKDTLEKTKKRMERLEESYSIIEPIAVPEQTKVLNNDANWEDLEFEDMFMFDYNKQLDIINSTEEKFASITKDYMEKLNILPKDTLHNLNIININKKFEVSKKKTPKGISLDKLEKIKEDEYNYYKNLIENYIYQYYGKKILVDSIEYKIFLDHLCEIEKENQFSATNVLEKYKNELHQTYLSISSTVDVALPIHGITEIHATNNRENQYLNEITDGIYATSGKGILDYIIRTNTGSMHGDGKNLDLPNNPFKNIINDKYILNEPASIYHLDANLFEPVVDFELNKDGRIILRFDQEWISRKEKIKCSEEIVKYVPKAYIDYKNITIQGKDLQEFLPSETSSIKR